jgi:hypothetical protein
MNDIPDATTVAFFRERLRKAGVIEELFEKFEGSLREQGLEAVVVRSLMQLWSLFPSRRLLEEKQ